MGSSFEAGSSNSNRTVKPLVAPPRMAAIALVSFTKADSCHCSPADRQGLLHPLQVYGILSAHSGGKTTLVLQSQHSKQMPLMSLSPTSSFRSTVMPLQ
jgi:hypothetical protein